MKRINILERSAHIYILYGLGMYSDFQTQFNSVDKTTLIEVWEKEISKFKPEQIWTDSALYAKLFKSGKDIPLLGQDMELVFERLVTFKKKIVYQGKLWRKEKSECENLALQYVQHNSILLSTDFRKKSIVYLWRSVYLYFENPILYSIILLIAFFSIERTIDGLTPAKILLSRYLCKEYKGMDEYDKINVSTLTLHFYEKSILPFGGAVCKDGWVSNSTGRGTCSHHGGVKFWVHPGNHSKSLDECKFNAILVYSKFKEKAEKRSWID